MQVLADDYPGEGFIDEILSTLENVKEEMGDMTHELQETYTELCESISEDFSESLDDLISQAKGKVDDIGNCSASAEEDLNQLQSNATANLRSCIISYNSSNYIENLYYDITTFTESLANASFHLSIDLEICKLFPFFEAANCVINVLSLETRFFGHISNQTAILHNRFLNLKDSVNAEFQECVFNALSYTNDGISNIIKKDCGYAYKD